MSEYPSLTSASQNLKDATQNIRDQWRDIVAQYSQPSAKRSAWQLINTLIPYIGLWYLMYLSLGVSYLLTLALAIPAAGFLVRIFIISHDCGHGAFFKSPAMNTLFGSITGLLCAAPYYYWKHDHALHHATAGNLDKRGRGDIWTMTVKEYLAASKGKRLAYRLYRNPVVMFGIGAFYVFVLQYRFPKGTVRERMSIWRMNIALAVAVLALGFTIGFKAFFLIQFPIFFLAAVAGAWLFYVQHQFEEVYWARGEEWDFVAGALEGSSYYKLPKVLQWFTGNIGFHHIHHLSAKIPNYYLEKCHKAHELFQQAPQLTLWSSFKCLRYRLFDEENGRLLSFGDLRRMQQMHQV
jgi:acyl-lipid omega-6 desaturase (Delta-12 desaturase)